MTLVVIQTQCTCHTTIKQSKQMAWQQVPQAPQVLHYDVAFLVKIKRKNSSSAVSKQRKFKFISICVPTLRSTMSEGRTTVSQFLMY